MKYAFLGAGKMALALIHGMLRAKLCATSDILVASRSKTNLENFVNASSVQGAATNFEAADEADVVVLCVKPADALKALEEAGDGLEGKLLVSVVTGLKIETLRDAAPQSRIVRAMPNTAAMVGKSATALAFEKTVSKKDQQVVEKIFQAVGTVYPVAENLLDAVTGLSGSGPAFVYLMMEALSDGGVEAGLSRKLALDLAIQTVMGAAEMASATAEHPAVLREMVTSPGGTTIAGLSVLEQAAVRSAFSRAVKAASERSKQLSNG